MRIRRKLFSSRTFFNIGSSHSQVDTRLYFVSHPLFSISQSTWHISSYLFCCLFLRFFNHICPCQWHPWNWYTVLVSGSYPSTKKDAGSFSPLSFKTQTVSLRSPPCTHILWWMFYRFLCSVPQSIDKQYNWILFLHHKTPSQTSLRYAWIYRLNKWFLFFLQYISPPQDVLSSPRFA